MILVVVVVMMILPMYLLSTSVGNGTISTPTTTSPRSWLHSMALQPSHDDHHLLRHNNSRSPQTLTRTFPAPLHAPLLHPPQRSPLSVSHHGPRMETSSPIPITTVPPPPRTEEELDQLRTIPTTTTTTLSGRHHLRRRRRSRRYPWTHPRTLRHSLCRLRSSGRWRGRLVSWPSGRRRRAWVPTQRRRRRRRLRPSRWCRWVGEYPCPVQCSTTHR